MRYEVADLERMIPAEVPDSVVNNKDNVNYTRKGEENQFFSQDSTEDSSTQMYT